MTPHHWPISRDTFAAECLMAPRSLARPPHCSDGWMDGGEIPRSANKSGPPMIISMVWQLGPPTPQPLAYGDVRMAEEGGKEGCLLPGHWLGDRLDSESAAVGLVTRKSRWRRTGAECLSAFVLCGFLLPADSAESEKSFKTEKAVLTRHITPSARPPDRPSHEASISA